MNFVELHNKIANCGQSWQRVPSLLIYEETLYIAYPPLFSNLFTLFALFVAFLPLAKCAIMSDVILLNDLMDLNLLNLGSFVLPASYCMFYATKHEIY